MKIVIDIILKYIASGKRIVIPNLGAFLVKQSTGEVIFSEFLKQDDGVLRGELVVEGMKSVEAAGAINRFVFEIRHALRNGESVDLDGIGTLSLDKLSSKILYTQLGSDEASGSTDKYLKRKPAKEREQRVTQTSEPKNSEGEVDLEDTNQTTEDIAKEETGADNEIDNTPPKAKTVKVFSGRFSDGDPEIEAMRYTSERNRGRKGGGYRSKPHRRYDFVLIFAAIVLIAAIGVVVYGVYHSNNSGEGNAISQMWGSVVSLFDGLF